MYELKIEQTIQAPIEAVYKAWLDAATMQKWFAPGDMTIPEVTSEAVIDGHYRIVMQEPNGEKHIVGGQYTELNPHTLIAFTWQWEGSPNITKVKIKLKQVSESETNLFLRHTEFVEEGFRDHHQQGWQGCLANLPKAFT